MKARIRFYGTALTLLAGVYLVFHSVRGPTENFTNRWLKAYAQTTLAVRPVNLDPFYLKLAEAAEERSKSKVKYDGRYLQIEYPNGDVPAEMGVCSDEVVRSYRKLGIDLQKEVHEDMSKAFNKYPKIWKLPKPDSNIDHRRVPNLMVFFSRHGEKLSIDKDPTIYLPGDIVAWDLTGGFLHIGLVVNKYSADGRRPLILHNIGAGPQIEDALYVGEIIGHFRYKKNIN